MIYFVKCQRRSNTPAYYTCYIQRSGMTVKASGVTPLEAYQRAIDRLAEWEG